MARVHDAQMTSSNSLALASAGPRSRSSPDGQAACTGDRLKMVQVGWSPERSRRQASWLASIVASRASANTVKSGTARRRGPQQPSTGGVGHGLVHRLPAVDQVAEGLRHPVHVAGPEVGAGAAVQEPALVLAEPAREGEVVQAGPDRQAGVAPGAQHLPVVLDRRPVVLSGPGLQAGPVQREAVVGAARARRTGRSPRRSGCRSRCPFPDGGHPAGPFPRQPSRIAVTLPRSGWTTRPSPT